MKSVAKGMALCVCMCVCVWHCMLLHQCDIWSEICRKGYGTVCVCVCVRVCMCVALHVVTSVGYME